MKMILVNIRVHLYPGVLSCPFGILNIERGGGVHVNN